MASLFTTNLKSINPYQQPTIEEKIKNTTVGVVDNNNQISAQSLILQPKRTGKNRNAELHPNLVSNNGQNLFQFNNYSYPLKSRNDTKVILSECIYLGSSNFLTCISRDLLRLIQTYPNNYYFLIDTNKQIPINDIYVFPQNLENPNLLLVVFKTSQNINDLEGLSIPNIIETSSILEYEINGVQCISFRNYFEEVHGNIISVDKNIITTNLMDGNEALSGSPLIVRDKIIGISIYIRNNMSCYIRLSSILYWVNHFYKPVVVLNKMKSTTIEPTSKIHLSEEQLYQIIYGLNDRVKTLEETVRKLSSQQK